MHLISALAGGVQGAADGTVAIRQRATLGPVQVYSDYTGTPLTYVDEFDLDSNGGMVIYVNESVDVAVYDSTHALVRQWTEMWSDALTEYIGPAFTGTDYAGGAVGVQKPVTLETLLDRVTTSFGTTNWNVLTLAGPMTIQSALAMQMQVWNVRSAPYSATGGGVADDAAAIAACVAACAAAGGGIVWFPPGTYLIRSQIGIPDGVHILGAGAGLSIIDIDDAGAHGFNMSTCAGPAPTIISGIKIVAHQANAGRHINASTATPVIIRDCIIGSNFSRGKLIYMNGTSKVYAATTQFIVGDSTTATVTGTVSADDLLCMLQCTVTGPANAYAPAPAMITCDNVRLHNVIVALNTTGAGTVTTVVGSHNVGTTALGGMVTGCTFAMNGASTASVVFNLGPLSATKTFRENDNELTGTIALWTSSGLVVNAPVTLGTRHRISAVNAVTNAATALATDQYDTIYVTITGVAVGAPTFVPALAPRGCKATIVMLNNSGVASGVYKLDIFAGLPDLINSTNIANTDAVVWLLESIATHDGAGTLWTIVGASIDATALEMEEFTT